MQHLIDFFSSNDHFANHCGIELLEAGSGRARACMVIQPYHLNGAETVHGGAIFTLADFVFAVAANSSGQLALAINTTTSFLKAVRGGTLYASAEQLAINRRLGNYQVRILNQQDELIAIFHGTAYRKDERLLPDTADSPEQKQ